MKRLITILLFLSVSTIFAQTEDYLEILRSDLKTEKVSLITYVMDFTDAESEAFWPIHREYTLKNDEIGDNTVKLIKNYAEHYDNMTEEKAEEILEASFDLKEDKLDLKRKYFDKISDAIGKIKAAKFIQLDNQFDAIINLQITSELPLLEEKNTK